MPFPNTHRWKERFQQYAKALAALDRAIATTMVMHRPTAVERSAAA